MQYFSNDGSKVRCLLCAHTCKLAPGAVGICGVNQNSNNSLECLVYGYPAAIHIDPIEKKPLYHFLPSTQTFSLGTVGCNFRCPFCQNWQISQQHSIDRSQYITPKEIVRSALYYGCNSISFTYNEPTIFYPYAKDIALLAKKEGLKTIFVSNGFMSDEVAQDMQGVIDAFNIDIKSFQNRYYKKVLKGGLSQILSNLLKLKQNGHWLEITTLIVPNHNDSKEELQQIASFIYQNLGADTPWHINAFYPNYKELNTPSTSLKSLQRAYSIAKEIGLQYVYIGNIGASSNTICPQCGSNLIIREGFFLLENRLIQNRCPKCSTKIAGVFL